MTPRQARQMVLKRKQAHLDAAVDRHSKVFFCNEESITDQLEEAGRFFEGLTPTMLNPNDHQIHAFKGVYRPR